MDGVVPELGRLLRHPDDGVRAKCCNLIGNMCRHDSAFYKDLKQNIEVGGGGVTILSQLIDRCMDADAKVSARGRARAKRRERVSAGGGRGSVMG
jgi:fused-like protein